MISYHRIILRNFISLMLIITMVIFLSCDKQSPFVKCEDCLEQEPVQALIQVKLDPYELSSQPVEIKIYQGNLEDNLLESEYTSDSFPVSFSVYINKKYTITATYTRNSVKYTAVDSATPRVKYEPEKCETPCYFIYDNVIDLRIRYTQ
jgi:hypothetical protein